MKKNKECWKKDGKLLVTVIVLTYCLALHGMFWQMNLILLQSKGQFCVNKEAWSMLTSSSYSCTPCKSPPLSCDLAVVTAARPAAWPLRVMAHPSRARQGSWGLGAGQRVLPLGLSKGFKSTQERNIHFQCQGTHGWGWIFLHIHGRKNTVLVELLSWIPVRVAIFCWLFFFNHLWTVL